METRSRKKKRESSGSTTEQRPIPRDKSGPSDGRAIRTPRPHKRVRFSDAGPVTQGVPDDSTGLTPALCRASFKDRDSAIQRTPTRSSRRHSTPLARSRRVTDSPMPRASTSPENVLHFTPLRQLLDTRTQRRIRRIGLSDEINNLEREKRTAAQNEKSLETLLRERDSLKQELEMVKRGKTPTSQLSSDNGEWMAPGDRIEHLESDNDRLRAQLSFSAMDNYRHLTPSESDACTVDTILVNDSGFEGDTVFMSDSPTFHAADTYANPDEFSLSPSHPAVDVPVQTSRDTDLEFTAISQDLEAARKEKRDLFESCRSRLNLLGGTALERHLREGSPPAGFLDDIVPSLMQTLARASDATQTLSDIQSELYSLGFQGANAQESVDELRNRFRTARLELERIVPGETANVGLCDGMSTLGALVKRVQTLVENLNEEQARHQGSSDREKALRGQFDMLLVRYESASQSILDLEESIASSAGDMLHTRMRMQELEREAQDHVVTNDRLKVALDKYRDEVTRVEDIITKLESENAERAETHTQQISELKQKIAEEENSRHAAQSTIENMENLIREREEVIEQNRIRVCDLTAKVESIERERQQAVENLEKNATEHEQEMGLMNVRVGELNTALEAARSEAEKLSRYNAGLKEQLRLEVEAKDGLLDKWFAEQTRAFTSMKAAVGAERRKAKVRDANWELKSDEIESDDKGLDCEPITPVSMTRFVDVEVGRGKHRRRLDSGIGVLTEDELEDDVDVVPSDPIDL
ncbi:uncharacterized protein DSM5745_08805 [Aspergillus mulundensis]|uniref:Uncharacterized protein n=1 Tax=Aspergillus mulundensis TaxID=1810919 RepID=A0A3D8R4R4_9EURO|nr:Uncharacterized protein DSM5745_08805 [Aspergillus mulundensis]RDW69045.1 Uncharacterized protein DSM5745_08805 [Aspergillus mulundensis]